MRTHQQLIEEIAFRKERGLPRIELTQEERVRAFGDESLINKDPNARCKYLVERLLAGLPMSIADKKTAKQYLKKIKQELTND